MDDDDKEEKIQNINEGLKGVLKNSKVFNQTEKEDFLRQVKIMLFLLIFMMIKKQNLKNLE